MKRIRLIQISNGVGSGNIGDELMAQEFWKLLPGDVVLDVPVLPEGGRYRGTYPAPHGYYPVRPLPALMPDAPGLLVGDTPVSEFEGLTYPLETVGPQISEFIRRGLPVDAIGVGVDRLLQPAARELFAKHYAGIRSWTVRSEACREALLDLGTPPEKIRVAADLAWLFTPGTETDGWAEEVWRSLGVSADRPLVAVNLVHHAGPMAGAGTERIAEVLDRLVQETGYQVAFLHNESRPGPDFDAGAAAGVRALMRESSVEVPPAYFTPQEMVSLLRPVSVVLSQRYHMAIQAILAGTIPVCLPRGPKLRGLAREFALPTAGWSAESTIASVKLAMARRDVRLRALAKRREQHSNRAGEALSFLAEHLAEEAEEPKRRSGVKRVAVIHLGGLGDLVLASGLFRALRRKYPKASLELFCRTGFAGIAELFPAPPDRVRPVGLQPAAHAEPGPALDAALRQLEEELGDWRPDVVIAAELEPTWLSWYLASRWGAPVNLACTRLATPRGLLRVLLDAAGRKLVEFSGPAWDAGLAEGERYSQLAAMLGAGAWAPPRWSVSSAQQQQTEAFLAEQGLGLGGYAVCFPLGAPSTLVKRWPAESFAMALEQSTDGFALPVLVTGEAGERGALQALADDLRLRGAKVAVFGGSVAELGLLAGLLAGAKFFVGNDTGPAHLAQAYGTPGVVVFGGGTWPHYRPWGRGAVGVVHPLACFGCGWDCAFGKPICLGGVTVDAVVRGLELAKANPAGPAQVVTSGTASAELQVLAASAARHYREVQADRLARGRTLVETLYAKRLAERERLAPAGEGGGLDGGTAPPEGEGQSSEVGVAAAGEGLGASRDWSPASERPQAGHTPVAGSEDQGGRVARVGVEIPAGGSPARAGGIPSPAGAQPASSLEVDWGAIAEIWPRRWSEAQLAADQRLELIATISRELEELRTQSDARRSALENADQLLRQQQKEIGELRTGYAARLVAIEEANVLLRRQQREITELREGHAARLVAIEAANTLLQRMEEEISKLRTGYADRLASIKEANVLLARQQEEITELRAGHAERLVAIEEANALLARQQEEITELRAGHAERLVAIEEANVLLRRQQEEITELRTGHAE
ncbi:MAG: glycosyltransferase family 9 protein, partial [Acidobacteriota bacterium]